MGEAGQQAAAPGGQPGPRKSTPQRVAIVGVHGVAHHDAGATANAMAELLLSLPSYRPPPPGTPDQPPDPSNAGKSGPCYYGSFQSVGIQIQLQPLKLRPEREPAPQASDSRWRVEETSALLARRAQTFATSQLRSEADADPGKEDDDFTRLLLENYKGAAHGNAYVTARLEGRRREVDGQEQAEVHIYEVLWADLAASTNSLLSFFLAFFQLILHLASLSRLAVDATAAECNSKSWRRFRNAQTYAVRVFQIPLPLLKVILLISLTGCIPGVSTKLNEAAWLAPVLMGIAGLAVAFLINRLSSRPVRSGPLGWSLMVIASPLLGAGVGWILVFYLHNPAAISAVAVWILFGASLMYWLLEKYEKVRRGARTYGWILYCLAAVAFAVNLCRAGGSVPQAGFWTSEWLVAAIRFSWWCFFLFAFAALILGRFAWRGEERGSEARARARAAVRTSRFALALPAFLFVALTSLIWASFFKITDWIHTPFFELNFLGNRGVEDFLIWARLIPDPFATFNPIIGCDYLRGVLAWSMGYQAPISLAIFMIALLLIVWWLLPSVLEEGYVLRNLQKPPRNSTNAESIHLGTWCSRGLDSTSVATILFWMAALGMPVLHLGLAAVLPQYASIMKEATSWLVVNWVVVIAGAAVVALVRYGSPALGAVLDVDNYLRTEPANETPRAKIFERYVSTLHYLAAYRGPDGRGYDKIIIVAHSLGALISADLLRYLRLHSDDAVVEQLGLNGDRSKVWLMTMGNPLRQLLNRFFPHLYQWVRPAPDNGNGPLPRPGTPKFDVSTPDPADLGVAHWVSIYRSGDYVGRSVWLDEWYGRTSEGTGSYPEPITKATDVPDGPHTEMGVEMRTDRRTEMCIGAGGHTRYWDDTAPDVAEELNGLI